MNNPHLEGLMPDFGEYSLESVLEEYQNSGDKTPSTESAESIAARSRRIVMDALGDTLRQYQKDAAAAPIPEKQPQEAKAPVAKAVIQNAPASVPAKPSDDFAADEPDEAAVAAAFQAETARLAAAPKPKPAEKKHPRVSVGEDGVITLRYDEPEPDPAEAPEAPDPARDAEPDREPATEQEPPTDGKSEPARKERPRSRRAAKSHPAGGGEETASEKALAPVIRLLATFLAKRQLQNKEAAKWPDPVEIRETPELSPGKAAKFYSSQLRPLRFRCRFATLLCVILAWISLQFPMAGMLGASVQLQAGACLVLSLAVTVAALDVFSTGLRQLFDLHPGSEALAALACALSGIDAALVLLGYGSSLPFCAVGSVALTAALWGERLTCSALRRTYKTAVSSKSTSVFTVAPDVDRGADGLLRSVRSPEGIVRRSETQDMCQTAYAAAAPILIGASLLFAIIASLGGQGGFFLHTLSALLSVSASFAAFFSFPLPYALMSRRLRNAGAAVAGYAGCADIGKTRRLVITDEDLFPPGTMKFSGINVLEGAFVSKVVSYTASLLAASKCGVAGVFNELMTRRGYTYVDVDGFKCHEGGGLSASVGEERILVGSTGFMNLMGIRLPQNINAKNAICTAIMGELVGVFTIEYIPISSVQEALVTLLRGRTQADFAIRDFNITPLMIRQLFRMPTDNFNFPSFRDRYRISGTAAAKDAPLSAVITRSGMMPMVEAAESGRKLYATCRINTILSLTGTILGMLIMFLLCRAGSFDTATAGNVLTFMFLWALPVVILSIGQSR